MNIYRVLVLETRQEHVVEAARHGSAVSRALWGKQLPETVTVQVALLAEGMTLKEWKEAEREKQ